MTMSGTASLRISVTFPQGYYSGSDSGTAEALPSPSRLHEALVAAAAGSPWAGADGRVLVAADEHRAALEWLEGTEPLGIVPPEHRLEVPTATRFRRRAAPLQLDGTPFEPRSALAGPVVYVWPDAPEAVVASLRVIAREVTHVGRADSIAIVEVEAGAEPPAGMYRRAARRGPGIVSRVAARGRTAALAHAYRESLRPGGHATGSLGKQAADVLSPVNVTATALRRFEPPGSVVPWPYEEVWELPIADPAAAGVLRDPGRRVTAAVNAHRAIVRAIGEAVPPFVTGRDGEGPLRGAGHLAIQIAPGAEAALWLGIPSGVVDAERELVRATLERSLRFNAGNGKWCTAAEPRERSAVPFWAEQTPLMRTVVPLVLDAPGRPRNAPWSMADAVTCSIAYAMRGVLEHRGVEWGQGWDFRRTLVTLLRDELGVGVIASRVPASAFPYAYRVGGGDLAVAVHAIVRLGDLAPEPGGFLALGRARHLGGGLLVPVPG
jgi:CRISPR-associated protein Csb2